MARLLVVSVLLAFCGRAVPAKDEPSAYPEGTSAQAFGDHRFELVVPAAADSKPPWSLVVVLDGDYDVAQEYGPLAKQGYVVCSPKPKLKGGMFAASEVDEILDLRDHLASSLPLAKDRLHVVTVKESRGISSFLAFHKRADAVSYTLVSTFFTGKSPSADAKKRLGVLFLGKPDNGYGDPAKSAAALSDKVRTVEYRPEEGVTGPYFAYWLGVMDGRYEPGRDLSFEWIEDAAAPPPSADALDPAKPASPGRMPALEEAKESSKAKRVGALVYFWSAEDAATPEGRNIQNVVFLESDVRAAGKPLLSVKLDRAKYPEAFTQMGLTTTPAVVVVDADFNVLDRFEGLVKASLLAKALVKAAGKIKPK